jgi:hypothetical protein
MTLNPFSINKTASKPSTFLVKFMRLCYPKRPFSAPNRPETTLPRGRQASPAAPHTHLPIRPRSVSIEVLKQGCSTRVGLRNTLEPDPDNTGVGSFLRSERPSSPTPFAARAPLFHVNHETKGPHARSRICPRHNITALPPRTIYAHFHSFWGHISGFFARFAALSVALGAIGADRAGRTSNRAANATWLVSGAAIERAESYAAATEARAGHDNRRRSRPG